MVSEALRTALLLSLIGAFAWVATGTAYELPHEPSFALTNASLCIHRPVP